MNKVPDTILCVGSLHYDILVESPRIPRQEETVTARRWIPKYGGKGGNQAVAAAGAGAYVRMLGAVGNDSFGAIVLAHLRSSGVDSHNVHVLAGPTAVSVAITESNGEYGAAIVSGANLEIPPTLANHPELWTDVAFLMLQIEVTDGLNIAAARSA